MDIKDVYLNRDNKPINLGRADGHVESWNGYDLPEILSYPYHDSSRRKGVLGYRINNRSALISADEKWFKLKGCRPRSPGCRWTSGEPFGAMSKKKCLNELKANEKIAEVCASYEIPNALTPAGYIDYERGDIHCAILETRGETRLSSVDGYFLTKVKKEGPTFEYIDRLFSNLAGWLGFSAKIFKEAKVLPSANSLDTDNWAVYRVDGGYGVSRVDLASSRFNTNEPILQNKKRVVEIDWVTDIPFGYSVVPVAKKLGVFVGDVLKGFDNDGNNIMIAEVQSESEERLLLEKNTKVLCVARKRFWWIDKLEKEYYRGLESDSAPQPIERNLIECLFDA